jgi:hypothetical protein
MRALVNQPLTLDLGVGVGDEATVRLLLPDHAAPEQRQRHLARRALREQTRRPDRSADRQKISLSHPFTKPAPRA